MLGGRGMKVQKGREVFGEPSADPKIEPSPFGLSGCCGGVEAQGGEWEGGALPLAPIL
jgi:hypothetical protein